MNNLKFQLIFIISIITYTQQNIWDNIFGNKNAPQIYFPTNFQLKLSMQDPSTIQLKSSYSVKIKYSSDLSIFELEGFVTTLISDLSVGQFQYNITDNTGFSKIALDQKCNYIQMPQLSRDQITLSQLNSMDMNDLWRFIAYYNGIEHINGENFHKFDITTLYSMLNIEKTKTWIYFDESLELSKIVFKNKNVKINLYVVEPLEDKDFTIDDFNVVKHWGCNLEEMNELDYSDQYMSDFVEIIEKEIEERGGIEEVQKEAIDTTKNIDWEELQKNYGDMTIEELKEKYNGMTLDDIKKMKQLSDDSKKSNLRGNI